MTKYDESSNQNKLHVKFQSAHPSTVVQVQCDISVHIWDYRQKSHVRGYALMAGFGTSFLSSAVKQYLRLSTFWRSIRRCWMKIKSRRCRYLARERKLREIKKTVLPTAVNNKAKTALPTVKLIRKFPSTKSEKLPVRPVPARHLAIDVRPRPSAIDVRPRPSAVDHRPSTIGDEQRRSLQVKVFVLTLFRLIG